MYGESYSTSIAPSRLVPLPSIVVGLATDGIPRSASSPSSTVPPNSGDLPLVRCGAVEETFCFCAVFIPEPEGLLVCTAPAPAETPTSPFVSNVNPCIHLFCLFPCPVNSCRVALLCAIASAETGPLSVRRRLGDGPLPTIFAFRIAFILQGHLHANDRPLYVAVRVAEVFTRRGWHVGSAVNAVKCNTSARSFTRAAGVNVNLRTCS